MSASHTPPPGRAALFLDRDGVINQEHHYVHRIEQFIFIDGVFATCRQAQALGYALVVVTNQSGIARGLFTSEAFYQLDQWMHQQFLAQGVKLLKTYFCPYHPTQGTGPYRQDAPCRKPRPGMIEQACRDFSLDPGRSLLVGDKISDLEAAQAAGLAAALAVRSGHPLPDPVPMASAVLPSIKEVGPWLVAWHRASG